MLGFVFTLLAYVVGGIVFWWAAKGRDRDPRTWRIVLWGLVGAGLGAKVSQLVSQGWPITVPPQAAFDAAAGGRALLGGLIFGWFAVEIAKRNLNYKGSLGDPFAFALAAGEAVGRIGCYFNGCCYGTKCNLPWAIEQHGALRHPSQIYSSLTAALIFVVLVSFRKRWEGSLFKLYLLLFASTRFAIEFTRERGELIGGLSIMQWFCLEILLVLGVSTLVRRRRPVEARA